MIQRTYWDPILLFRHCLTAVWSWFHCSMKFSRKFREGLCILIWGLEVQLNPLTSQNQNRFRFSLCSLIFQWSWIRLSCLSWTIILKKCLNDLRSFCLVITQEMNLEIDHTTEVSFSFVQFNWWSATTQFLSDPNIATAVIFTCWLIRKGNLWLNWRFRGVYSFWTGNIPLELCFSRSFGIALFALSSGGPPIWIFTATVAIPIMSVRHQNTSTIT